MLRSILRAKIHRLTVTETNVNYEGSITLDEELIDAADIVPGEKVQVVNVNSGVRFETYVIAGLPGSGEVCLNGAAAHLAALGDIIIVINYGLVEEREMGKVIPRIVYVDQQNRIIREPALRQGGDAGEN